MGCLVSVETVLPEIHVRNAGAGDRKRRKPLWGRGHCGYRPVKYEDELVAHMKWLAQRYGLRVAIDFGARMGMNKHYVRQLADGVVRASVPARQSSNEFKWD